MTDHDERRVHLRREVFRDPGELSVEHLSVLFDDVVADFDGAPARTNVLVPARRRSRQVLPCGR